MQYPEFQGKTVIVTGGSSGIGRAIATRFGTNGANVVVSSRSAENCEATCDAIRAGGGEATTIVADVSRINDVEQLVQRTTATYGGLDYGINNAATLMASQFSHQLDEQEWDRLMATNLKSVWAMMKYQVPAMIERGGGAIVNIASVAGQRAVPTYAAYGASKAGVNALTASVAHEVADHKIRVNAVSPGLIDTPMAAAMDPQVREMIDASIPMGRRGTPEEVAGLALWLCSEQAAYLTGQSLRIDGGSTT